MAACAAGCMAGMTGRRVQCLHGRLPILGEAQLTLAVEVLSNVEGRGEELGEGAGGGEVADGGPRLAAGHHAASARHQEGGHCLGMLAEDIEGLRGQLWGGVGQALLHSESAGAATSTGGWATTCDALLPCYQN